MRNARGIQFFFWIAFMAAVLFPLVNFFYIFPLFSNISVKNAEKDASRIARHLAGMLLSEEQSFVEVQNIHPAMERIAKDFNLWKVRIFSKDGLVLYSTDTDEEGTIVEKEHLNNVVREFRVFSKLTTREMTQGTGETLKRDVVEVYVPVVIKGSLAGTFEIYYDITDQHQSIHTAVEHSSVLLLLFMFVLFISVPGYLLITDKRKQAEVNLFRRVRRQSPYYLFLVIAFSVFVAELAVMMIVYSFPNLSISSSAVLDAGLLVLLVSPVLYYFLLRPLMFQVVELNRSEGKLRASLNDKEVLLKEVHHRVKNNLQIIASMLGIQSRQLEEGAAKSALTDSENRVRSIAMIHEMLYTSADLASLKVGRFFRDIATRLIRQYQNDGFTVDLSLDVPDQTMEMDILIPCGLILNELLTNSFKHAYPKGGLAQVAIILREDSSGSYTLLVRDDGTGMPEDFDAEGAKSLGIQIVRAMVAKLGGQMEVHSNGGSEFRIMFEQVPKEKKENEEDASA